MRKNGKGEDGDIRTSLGVLSGTQTMTRWCRVLKALASLLRAVVNDDDDDDEGGKNNNDGYDDDDEDRHLVVIPTPDFVWGEGTTSYSAYGLLPLQDDDTDDDRRRHHRDNSLLIPPHPHTTTTYHGLFDVNLRSSVTSDREPTTTSPSRDCHYRRCGENGFPLSSHFWTS